MWGIAMDAHRTRIVGLLRRALPTRALPAVWVPAVWVPAAILLLPLLVAACGPGGSHY
jgi:hypothetical protein